MTYTQEKIDAYQMLENAVEALRAAYRDDDDTDVLTGYVLLTSAVDFASKTSSPDDDDLDTYSISGWYCRRGQPAVLSYGIVHEGLRHYNDRQKS